MHRGPGHLYERPGLPDGADRYVACRGAFGPHHGALFAMARAHFARKAEAILEMAMLWLRAGLSVGFFIGSLLGAGLYVITGFQGVLWGIWGATPGFCCFFCFTGKSRAQR
ncbi:hypothetical protein LJK88_32150 [Paenibacillus sp. P26]|nr:hypothetical protein LJK88_32150 [Paenibacillus sp. P26]